MNIGDKVCLFSLEGMKDNLVAIVFSLVPPFIYCATDPSGAYIHLDGNAAMFLDRVLKTPSVVTNVSLGKHWITFRKGPNYVNRDIEVTVIRGEFASAKCTLETGKTVDDFFVEIEGKTIDKDSMAEGQCKDIVPFDPWCSADLDKWIKPAADWHFIYKGNTHFCIFLDTSGGNPLPSSSFVNFEHEAANSYAIPEDVFLAALAALPLT